jgi:signal transduction histidine kinase
MTLRSARPRSITRRLIASVLLVELIFALAMTLLAGLYERHEHLRTLDIALEGRTDSILGAVQDAEDPEDNVKLDRTGLQLPPHDVYEVRDTSGRLLGRSPNWSGPTREEQAAYSHDGYYNARINHESYRLLVRRGMRIVDPGDKGGGTPRHVVIFYGAPTARLWGEVQEAMVFFSLSNLGLLAVTGLLMAWLLHRGLAPMRQLAAEAEKISARQWSFRPPESAVQTRELAPLASALAAAMQRLEASFFQQQHFVSDAAHELKTAVAVVKSSLQLLNMRSRTPAEYQAGIEVSLDDCQRMEDIVLRMLLLARTEAPTTPGSSPALADLAAAAHTTLRHFRPMAEVRLVALSVSADHPATVPISAEECLLLCSNLVLNALQHSRPNSAVRVSVQAQQSEAMLRVEDEGDGIDPALLPHVFERFSRGDPSRSRNTGGTGLGLAICRAIVDRAGGTIALESELDRGTTAIVRLPRAAVTATPDVTSPSTSARQFQTTRSA